MSGIRVSSAATGRRTAARWIRVPSMGAPGAHLSCQNLTLNPSDITGYTLAYRSSSR